MQPKVYDILMDVKKGLLNNEIIKVVTGDYGMNRFNLKLLKDRLAPYNLKNTIVRIMVVTPSGSKQQQDLIVENAVGGSANITLKQSLFSESGAYIAEFQIFDETTQVLRLTTPRFKYFAVESLQDDETILASDEFSILQGMIKDVGDINNNINGKVKDHNSDKESHPSLIQQLKDIVSEKPWIKATLLNGFTGDAYYYKDSLGVVRFRGKVFDGVRDVSTAILNIPTGYGVGEFFYTPIVEGFSSGELGSVSILRVNPTNISLPPNTPPTKKMISLDGISYRAVV